MRPTILNKGIVLLILAVTVVAVSASFARAATIGTIIPRENQFFEQANKELLSFMAGQDKSKKHKFIIQRPHADLIAIKNAARKFAAVDVDVIVTYGSTATLAALDETSGIPIIYLGVYDGAIPKNKAKRASGICSRLPVSSLLRYLNTSVNITNLAVLYSSIEEDTVLQLEDVIRTAEKYGFSLTKVNVEKAADITSLLSGIKANAYFITSSSVISSVYPTVSQFAQGRKAPTASLLYYESIPATFQLTSNPKEHGRKAGEKLLLLLNGKRLRDISTECSRDIELVFNLREARDLGIRIPMDLVTEATRVIY
jgi:putative ABC transport system substrate-binding protein